jgi:hypothetical protein
MKQKILLKFSVDGTIVPRRLYGELLKRYYSDVALYKDEYSNCSVVCCKLYSVNSYTTYSMYYT